jgi:tripartite-type tricarboxylate transporter receptor subunit TctC
MMSRRLLLGLALVAATGATGAEAETAYPPGPVRMVVGFAPGGGNDILARILADKLQIALGKPFVVDNRPGANGMIAIDAVKRAPPDGLTLLVGPSSGMTVNPAVLKTITYDPVKDFAPIAIVGYFPLIVVVNPSFPAKSIADLIATAKSQPGKINYSSAASSFQLATEMFAQRAGIAIQHIPYKGSAPAVSAVVANDVSLTFGDAAAVLPFIQSGTLRALAVTTPARIPSLPDIPTVSESGLPGFDMVLWSALFGPSGTPSGITALLEREVQRIVALPDVRERMKTLGVEPAGVPGEQLARTMQDEIERYRKVADTAGIKLGD